MREKSNPYLDGSIKGSKKQNKTKPLLSGNKAWHSQHNVVVVAGQPANQCVVLEGHPQ